MSDSGWWEPGSADTYETPEAAALSGWQGTPTAHARVVAVRPGAEDGAVWVSVQLDTDPPGFHDLDIVTCSRTRDGRWFAAGSTGASSS